jgi:hypothetical protein
MCVFVSAYSHWLFDFYFPTTYNTLSPGHTQQREALRCSLEYFSEGKHVAECTMKVRHKACGWRNRKCVQMRA